MRTFILLFFSLIFHFHLAAGEASAQSATSSGQVVLSPSIIEEKTNPGDMFEYELKIVNGKDRKVSLYPIAWDEAGVSLSGSSTESAGPLRARSLASWMTLSRGVVELMPGEERIESLKVNISGQAEPGVYYADVFFSEGSNRWDAEGAAKSSIQPKTVVRYEIKKKVVEQAELSGFMPSKEIFLHTPVSLRFSVRNAGGEEINPTGNVRFYNRRGEEIDTIEIGGKKIAPDSTEIFEIDWQPKKKIGRFKARLAMEYGIASKRDLQDSCYFWVMPKPYLIMFFSGLGFAFILLIAASVIGKRRAARHRRIRAAARRQTQARAVVGSSENRKPSKPQ